MEGWRKGAVKNHHSGPWKMSISAKYFQFLNFFLRVSNLSAVFVSLHPPYLHQLLCPSTPLQIYNFSNYYCFTHHTCVRTHTQR